MELEGDFFFQSRSVCLLEEEEEPHIAPIFNSAYLACHLKMAAVAASPHRNTSYGMSGAANNLAIFNTHTQPVINKCSLSLSLSRWISTFLFPPISLFQLPSPPAITISSRIATSAPKRPSSLECWIFANIGEPQMVMIKTRPILVRKLIFG